MMPNIDQLSNAAAVEALSLVAQSWMQHSGREVYQIYHGLRSIAAEQFDGLPAWARDTPVATDESGEFARKMLATLIDAEDDEVKAWTREALEEIDIEIAHVEPVTLTIGGIILIGAILASRVKKIGSVTFYKDIPDNLANVIKAGANIPH